MLINPITSNSRCVIAMYGVCPTQDSWNAMPDQAAEKNLHQGQKWSIAMVKVQIVWPQSEIANLQTSNIDTCLIILQMSMNALTIHAPITLSAAWTHLEVMNATASPCLQEKNAI